MKRGRIFSSFDIVYKGYAVFCSKDTIFFFTGICLGCHFYYLYHLKLWFFLCVPAKLLTQNYMDQKRIVFIDWIRVVACFLVMLVHASENFYAADASGQCLFACKRSKPLLGCFLRWLLRSNLCSSFYDSISFPACAYEAWNHNDLILQKAFSANIASCDILHARLLPSSSCLGRNELGTVSG